MADKPNVEYVLTMNSDQLLTCLKAVELLMRLKICQYEELPFELCDLSDPDFCDRRDDAKQYLRLAFDEMFRGKAPGTWKDARWHRLYGLYQVMRKARHDAEYPESKGVDSYDPISTDGEKLPGISWRAKG